MEQNNVSAGSDRILSRHIAFATPWFNVVAKRTVQEEAPFYALRMLDYVTVVAITKSQELVLVKQYRPIVERHTLELPSGHVEKDELPAEAARRELREECGLEAGHLELLGTLISDTGRNENRLWCYLAREVLPISSHVPEAGIEAVLVPARGVPDLIATAQFDHALNLAALMLVVAKYGPQLLGIQHQEEEPRRPDGGFPPPS